LAKRSAIFSKYSAKIRNTVIQYLGFLIGLTYAKIDNKIQQFSEEIIQKKPLVAFRSVKNGWRF
jgi:hypothetical protein